MNRSDILDQLPRSRQTMRQEYLVSLCRVVNLNDDLRVASRTWIAWIADHDPTRAYVR